MTDEDRSAFGKAIASSAFIRHGQRTHHCSYGAIGDWPYEAVMGLLNRADDACWESPPGGGEGLAIYIDEPSRAKRYFFDTVREVRDGIDR